MNPEQLNALGSSIKEAIAVIADNLGVAASHVYDVLVRQQIAEGVTGLLAPVALVIAFLVAWNLTDKDSRDFEDQRASAIAAWVISAFFFFITLFTIPSTIQKLINPEYFALRDIAEMVNPSVTKND